MDKMKFHVLLMKPFTCHIDTHKYNKDSWKG